MDPRRASSAFPPPIRARLSTEDSASDATSSDSDDGSGVYPDKEDEGSYESALDDAASLNCPFMPKARITRDDEDDMEDEMFDADDDDDADDDIARNEEDRDSIIDVNDQIEAVSSRNVEHFCGGVYEGFDDGFVSGKEGSVLSNGIDEEDDRSPLIPSMEELQHAALENEGGLSFNDAKLEMNGSVEDSIADLLDQIGVFSSINVEQSHHFTGGGYEGRKEGSVFSNGSDEEDDIAGDESPLIPSMMELQDDALENEGGLGFSDAKLEMNGSDVVELEVEDDLDSIADVHDQIEAVSSVIVDQSIDTALELEDLVVESGTVGTEMKNLSVNIEQGRKSFMEAVKIEAEEAEFGQFDNDSSEFKGFETKNVVDFVSDQILDLMAPTYSKAFEPRTPEECADNLKNEEANHAAGEILERYYPTVEIPAGFLDSFEEEEDESRAIVTQVSITENYNGCEYSESESRFDSFHAAHNEGSGEEDELVISEWLTRDASLESSEIMKNFLIQMEEGSSSSHSGFESSINRSGALDALIVFCSDEESETEDDPTLKELFDTSVLAAFLRTPSDTSEGVPQNTHSATSFSIPTCRSVSIAASSTNNEERTSYLKIDQLRLKYLHLVRRLGLLAGSPFPGHALSKEDFVLSCKILVLGKTGVGKSAAINSIFGEERASTDPFQPATASVREFSGVVDGVYINLIDTPGLLTSLNDRGANRKILSSVKKCIRRSPPDAVLYVDRLDVYTRDFDDVPMLRMITSMLGSSIWNNAIITLTHAASTFSDGPDGSCLCYEAAVARRSSDIQRSIQRAAGDIRLVNPVALVENHSSCSRNMKGEILLPNGLSWRPWLLLLCYSFKILTEADTILKSESSPAHKLFRRSILSPLLKSKVHFNPSRNQGEEDYDYDSDIGLNIMTNEIPEEDDEYEAQKLITEQKSAYLLRKLKLLDTLSPLSFHDENSPYPCQFLERKSRVLDRPDMHIRYRDRGSDYDGVIIEESFDLGRPFLISMAFQITKDKHQFFIYPGSSIASKHGENPLGETKFMDSKKNKTAPGISVTFLGDTWVNGFKLEDQIFHGKKLPLAASIGIVRAERDVAYGAKLEFRLTERDFPVGANLQTEFSTGRNSRISVLVGLTDPNTGRISIKTGTIKQVHVAILSLFTIALSICRSIWSSEAD